jgi:putative oxidoreductase
MTGAYRDIVEPQRLVFTSAALDEKGQPLFEVLNTVMFAEPAAAGGKTTLTLHARVVKTTTEAERYLAGMEAGWTQTLERLGDYLATVRPEYARAARADAGSSQAGEDAAMSAARIRLQDRTAVDVSLLLVRVIVGVIFAAHGAQKLFGAFDGPGLTAMVKMMGPIGYLVTIGEFFGGLGLIVGFLCRFSAASIIVIMIGAIAMVHGRNGFFLGTGPDSTLSQAGFEYNLALIGLLAPILLAGAGRFAIGRLLRLPRSRRTGRPIAVLE